MFWNKYQKLNVFSAMAEMYVIFPSHSFEKRVNDLEVLCENRAMDDKISLDDALKLFLRENMIAKSCSLAIMLASIIFSVIFSFINYPVSIILAFVPLSLVLFGIIMKKKILKEFKKENIHLYTY